MPDKARSRAVEPRTVEGLDSGQPRPRDQPSVRRVGRLQAPPDSHFPSPHPHRNWTGIPGLKVAAYVAV